MKRTAFSLLLALAALTAWWATAPQPVEAEGFEWITNYQEGLKKAREENKPIFLEFR